MLFLYFRLESWVKKVMSPIFENSNPNGDEENMQRRMTFFLDNLTVKIEMIYSQLS